MTKQIAFKKFNCLLPENIAFDKWAVVACDQYTSSEKYWNNVKEVVGNNYSTLNLILPEIYLQKDNTNYINEINNNMINYLDKQIFKEYKDCYIYVERTISNHKVRKGIVGVCDLEQYSFNGDKTEIMPSEQVVIERILPRKTIREKANLELSHAILFINDKEDLLFQHLSSIRNKLTKLYDFELMENGGHIVGYLVTNDDAKKFDELYRQYVLNTEKLNIPQLIVGDGNHSLAAAKSIYEDSLNNSILRYAMVEIQNIYDSSIDIEPIHRILFDVEKDNFINYLKDKYTCNLPIKWLSINEKGLIQGQEENKDLLDVLQPLIDEYLKENKGRVDYVHEGVEEIVKNNNSIGLIIPPISKEDIFKRIMSKGVYQRKTFSIGKSNDKRYYLEARRIK